jgi:hypothetical protein
MINFTLLLIISLQLAGHINFLESSVNNNNTSRSPSILFQDDRIALIKR